MRSLPLVRVLARSFLVGEPELESIVARGEKILGRPWSWLRPLARRFLNSVAGKTRPRHSDVVTLILRDPGFERAWLKHSHELRLQHWVVESQQMRPVAAAESWDVPAIVSVADLADWLWLEPGDVEWFADLKGLGYKSDHSRLGHYHYRVLAKEAGSVRLIEAPKRRLKRLQRQILDGILATIPPHPSAHGFLKGRSIKTFATPHVGQPVVLRMDLRDFFVSFAARRIQTFFRTLGYPEPVADLLGGMCTNAVPRNVWRDAAIEPAAIQDARVLYSRPHLPQGAPTSPALANLCAFRMDCRLTGLAQSADAQYTRYADDLAFSGDGSFERGVERFSAHVAAILLAEGFAVNHRKTRIMRQGVRQHLAGVVTNQRMNVMRPDFDRLKAILTNCVRLGPQSQNREAHPAFRSHLEGRVGFVEMINSDRGKKLRAILERIDWEI